eukprot:CCRYP_001583-RA/>CCRYP_001583-RA protein AED:0.46 eAED:0.61 QI:0/0/0/1/0/0/2/0/117
MLHTADLDIADTVNESEIADFLTNASWAIRSTYHTLLKTSPGEAIFGQDMLLDVPFIADWSKIGKYTQKQRHKTQDEKMIPFPVTKYCCVKMVSSAKQKASMKVILEPSHQFIQMAP